jgi:hypothetical protein
MTVEQDGIEWSHRHGTRWWANWPRWVGRCKVCRYRTLPFLDTTHAEEALDRHMEKKHYG